MVRKIFPADAAYPYGCTPDIVNTNLAGSIEDGSGPQQNYDPNVNCSWLIDPQTANDSVTKIQLNFIVLDTESEDIITIYDGETTSAPVLGTYSGTVPPASPIYSTGNKMLIVFQGDGDATTAAGFRIAIQFYPTHLVLRFNHDYCFIRDHLMMAAEPGTIKIIKLHVESSS